MAFVNEYISEENIEKFEINELMNSYRRNNPFPNELNKLYWTMNKENGSWFMWVSAPRNQREIGVYTGEDIFIFNYRGKSIEVVLRKLFDESSEKIIDNPFYVSWSLDRIEPESLIDLSNNEIIYFIKEALCVYGTDGIETPVPAENILVNCKF